MLKTEAKWIWWTNAKFRNMFSQERKENGISVLWSNPCRMKKGKTTLERDKISENCQRGKVLEKPVWKTTV